MRFEMAHLARQEFSNAFGQWLTVFIHSRRQRRPIPFNPFRYLR